MFFAIALFQGPQDQLARAHINACKIQAQTLADPAAGMRKRQAKRPPLALAKVLGRCNEGLALFWRQIFALTGISEKAWISCYCYNSLGIL
jgi:hypothetical protein